MANTNDGTTKARKPATKKSSTERIFGPKVMAHGFVGVPNILVRGQKRLGITPTQFNILVQLLSYYYDPDRPPFPSKRELAERIDITQQTLRINIKALEDAGLLQREQQKTSAGDYGSNRYHLTGLIEKLKKLEPDFAEERKERQEARKLTERPRARAEARAKGGMRDGGTE